MVFKKNISETIKIIKNSIKTKFRYIMDYYMKELRTKYHYKIKKPNYTIK